MRKYVLRTHVPARNPNNSRPPSSSNIRTYVTYLECQRNQAERIGGIAYDGCMEFLASGPEGTPAALICAACQCNRSFHRLVVRTEAVNDHDAAPASSSHPPPPPPPPPAAHGAATTT